MELRRAVVGGDAGPVLLVLVVLAGVGGGFPSARQAPAGQDINERFRSADLDTAAVAARFESADREAFARRHDVVAALGLEPGMAVADVGAGSGFYAELMAAAVGPTGTVYAVEIAPQLDRVPHREVRRRGLDNVRVVRGTGESVELPAASVDLVFSSDTYHHFEDPPVILASIHRALKAGGRWVGCWTTTGFPASRRPAGWRICASARRGPSRRSCPRASVSTARSTSTSRTATWRSSAGRRWLDGRLAVTHPGRRPSYGSGHALPTLVVSRPDPCARSCWRQLPAAPLARRRIRHRPGCGSRAPGSSTVGGEAPVERSAFLVEDGVFSWVGSRGEHEPPAGAARVDLTGKTVIPALIDAHQHIGLTSVEDGTHSKDNYTRANLIEHLERSAYHGVAATMSLGLEFDEALAFELREEVVPNGARFLTSGRGIAATPMAGPQQEYRLGDSARGADRDRRPRRRRGAPRARCGAGQDLGRRPRRHGPQAAARGSTGRSSTRRTPAACR